MDILPLFAAPFIVGIVLLIVEHWVIVPFSERKGHGKGDIDFKNISRGISSVEVVSEGKSSNPLMVVYKLTSMFFISGLSSILPVILIRLLADEYYRINNSDLLNVFAEMVANSNLVFFIMSVISLVAGIILTLYILINSAAKISYGQQILMSMIFGILGGFFIWILIIFGFVLLLIYLIVKEAIFGKGFKENDG